VRAKQIASEVVAGLLLAGYIVAMLERLTPALAKALMTDSIAGVRWITLLLILSGATLGAVVLATTRLPTVTATAAGMLTLCYAPLLVDLGMPSWYPDRLSSAVLLTAGPAVFVVIGGLYGASAWGYFRNRRRQWQ